METNNTKDKSQFTHLWKLHEEQKPRLSDDEYKQIYKGSPFLESSKYKKHSKAIDSRSADGSSGFDAIDKYMFVCIILGVSIREATEYDCVTYEFMQEVYEYYMSKSTSQLFSLLDSESDTLDMYENIDRCHEWDWICEDVGSDDHKKLFNGACVCDYCEEKGRWG